MAMFDSGTDSKTTFLEAQIRLQLIIGLIGVPFLITSTFLLAFVWSYGSYSEYWIISDVFSIYAAITGVIGAAFTVVGTIGILQRNGSRLAWIFVMVYIIGWIWRYAFGYVIFPGVMAFEEIDSILAIDVIVSIYHYSLIIVSLYAWWSIHTVVASRPVYFSYIALYSLGGVVAYLMGGLLLGFGIHTIYSPEESLVLQLPNLIVTTLTYLVLFLFFISQLYNSRKESRDTISQDI
jgi:hypothetical protein